MSFQMCSKGQHSLIVVYKETPYSSMGRGEIGVRWCSNCGAVVVDLESDGRVSPGYVRKMQWPSITNEFCENRKNEK